MNGKVFVTGGEEKARYVKDVDSQKALGTITPQMLKDWDRRVPTKSAKSCIQVRG